MKLAPFISAQRAFSRKTFGPNYDVQRITAHIRKELVEIEECGELEEWVDVILLAFDGAWRSGATPEHICLALQRKLDVNKKRKWPDWRTHAEGEPIEHTKETDNGSEHTERPRS